MDKITSILNLLVGSKEVDFEDVYNKLIEHDPYLTRDELKSIALKENLLSLQVNDEPLKLRRKAISQFHFLLTRILAKSVEKE